MSFFKQQAVQAAQTGTVEQSSNFELIPHETTVLAMITECAWTSYEGSHYISATWTVAKPDAYANRKVWQSFSLMDSDEKRLIEAQTMLLAIDKNAGGKIAAANIQKADDVTNELLLNLMNKPMLIKVIVYKNKNTGKERNIVVKISPRSENAPTPQPAPQSEQYDADIPF